MVIRSALTSVLALLLPAAIAGQTVPDEVFGLKSCGSSPPVCGNTPSAVPVHLFSFFVDGSGFRDRGTVTLAGAPVDVDGLAISPVHGLLAFRIDRAPNGQVDGSYLLGLDPHTAVAYPRGPRLTREVRGAAIDAQGALWTLDSAANELVRIDPVLGFELGAGLPLRESGRPFSVSDISDLAIAGDGTFHVTSRNEIYTLDVTTGDLTLVLTDTGTGNAGATFVTAAGPRTLITFDVNYIDDLFRYDLSLPNTPRTLLIGNVLPLFNAGRGDLASLPNDVVVARCAFRNGSGVNPAAYGCLSAPVVGRTWRATIDTTPLTAATIVAFALTPDPGLPFLGGEILVGLAPPPSLQTGMGSHSLTLPSVAAMIGSVVPTQGLRIDNVGPTTRLVPLNAQDLVVGL
ncbi:MAG: hypothetical protein IPM29_25130 [Planctomycetes bacterium]|nr:hypothetical protein [Planctomycetota bacterium]